MNDGQDTSKYAYIPSEMIGDRIVSLQQEILTGPISREMTKANMATYPVISVTMVIESLFGQIRCKNNPKSRIRNRERVNNVFLIGF